MSKRWGLILGLLCIALVLVGGTLQVAHTHAGGELSHTDCSLCATAHVVAHVVSLPIVLAAVQLVAPVQAFTPGIRPARLSIYALFTRPPPVSSTLA